MRWLTNFYDFRIKWTASAAIGIHPTKAWLSLLVNFKNTIWTRGRTICYKIVFYTWKKCHAMKAGSSAMTQRLRDRVSSWSMLALPDTRRPDRANPPTNFWWSLFLTELAWSTCTRFPVDSQQEMLCWGFKGVQEEINRMRSALFISGQWHFHQDNAPVQISNFDTDYLIKMGIKTVHHRPHSPDCSLWILVIP